MTKKMMKGNEALAEAALRGGMNFYVGYPITPSTEAMEYLAGRMPQLEDRVFMQAENEIATICIMMGAAASGRCTMTASSGPGTALMQEGMSSMSAMDLPCVVLNVQRYGNGMGTLDGAQTDYHRDTRGGGQGDYRSIVLSPHTIQEGVDLMYEAFDLAFRYRFTVVIQTEGTLGQMTEPVTMPAFKAPMAKPEWALDGTPHQLCNPRAGNQFELSPKDVAKRERARQLAVKDEMQRWESIAVEDADYVLVAYGLPARSCKGAVDRLREQGMKVGLIRPISLWPYPEKAFREVNPNVKAFLSVELNDMGQMVDDVALASKTAFPERNIPVYLSAQVCGVPSVKSIVAFCQDVAEGKETRVY